jgi:hypothetical protein
VKSAPNRLSGPLISWRLPSVGSTSLKPNVGHAGSSSESNSQTGKLLSTPPSTMYEALSPGPRRTGSKKNGMLMLIRTAAATSSSSGSSPYSRASRGKTTSRPRVRSVAITWRR